MFFFYVRFLVSVYNFSNLFNWWKSKIKSQPRHTASFYIAREIRRIFSVNLNALTLDFIFCGCDASSLPFEARFTEQMWNTRMCLHNEKLYLRFIIVNPFKLRLNFITSHTASETDFGNEYQKEGVKSWKIIYKSR